MCLVVVVVRRLYFASVVDVFCLCQELEVRVLIKESGTELRQQKSGLLRKGKRRPRFEKRRPRLRLVGFSFVVVVVRKGRKRRRRRLVVAVVDPESLLRRRRRRRLRSLPQSRFPF